MKQKLIPPFSNFTIYRSFFYGFMKWLWYLPVGFTILPYLFFLDKSITFNSFLEIIFGLIAIPIVLEIIRFIRVFTTYPSYPGWEKKIPFQFEGWEKLVQTAGFPSCEYWQLDVSIMLEFASLEAGPAAKLSRILENFATESNHEFYTPNEVLTGFANDPRKKWEVPGNFFQQKFPLQHCSLNLEGSVNCHVAHRVYQLIKNQLANFSNHESAIEKITITPAAKSYYIQPMRGQSESTAS